MARPKGVEAYDGPVMARVPSVGRFTAKAGACGGELQSCTSGDQSCGGQAQTATHLHKTPRAANRLALGRSKGAQSLPSIWTTPTWRRAGPVELMEFTAKAGQARWGLVFTNIPMPWTRSLLDPETGTSRHPARSDCSGWRPRVWIARAESHHDSRPCSPSAHAY